MFYKKTENKEASLPILIYILLSASQNKQVLCKYCEVFSEKIYTRAWDKERTLCNFQSEKFFEHTFTATLPWKAIYRITKTKHEKKPLKKQNEEYGSSCVRGRRKAFMNNS